MINKYNHSFENEQIITSLERYNEQEKAFINKIRNLIKDVPMLNYHLDSVCTVLEEKSIINTINLIKNDTCFIDNNKNILSQLIEVLNSSLEHEISMISKKPLENSIHILSSNNAMFNQAIYDIYNIKKTCSSRG